MTLRAPAEFTDLDQIRNTVIVKRDGAAVTLGQIAQVHDTYEKLTRLVRVNGERGLRVAIRKQAEANTVEVVRGVQARLRTLQESGYIPADIRNEVTYDQSGFISDALRSVRDAAIIGARELVGPLIAMTITLAAVYAPIGFQGGLTGALCREFAKKMGVKNFFDVNSGIAHIVLMEHGLVRPGQFIIGTDSHSTIYGALGAFGTGVGFS